MEVLILLGIIVSVVMFVLVVRFLAVVPDHLAEIAKYLRMFYYKDDDPSDDLE